MTNQPEASPPALAKAQITSGGPLAALVPQNLDDAFRLSKALAQSGDMVPKHFQGKPEMVMAAVIRGMEIGLAPMQALSNIAVINGRASLWGDALPALMQRAGHHLDSRVDGEGEKAVATASLTRGDTGRTIERTFSVADAKKAGLWGKAGPWQSYPMRMLAMRARSLACRDGAADALMGLQVAEEMRDAPEAARDVTPREGGFASIAKKARAPEPAPAEAEIVQEVEAHWTEAIDTSGAFPGSDEFTEGAKAYQGGAEAIACPYGDDLQKAADWLAGWDQARGAAE